MNLIGHSVSDATGSILTTDIAVAEFLQRSRRELVGMSYLDITHPGDRRRNATLVDRLPSEAAPITIRKRYVTPDGQPVEADVHLSRLGEGPDNGRLVGTLYLVTPEEARFAPAILWSAARQLAQINEMRRDLLGSDLFCDYPLAILLQLYLDEAEGRSSDVATLAVLVGLTPVAAIRWLRALEARELIELVDRGGVAQLTGIGVRKILQLLAATAR